MERNLCKRILNKLAEDDAFYDLDGTQIRAIEQAIKDIDRMESIERHYETFKCNGRVYLVKREVKE